MRPVGRMARAAAVAAATAAVVLAAGCATSGEPPPAATARGAATHGTGSQGTAGDGTGAHATPADTTASCDPEASSLAPSGPPSVSAGSFAARIRARGYLIAGVDQSTYHFGFLNPIDNKIEGFDIDMVDAVAQSVFGSGYQSHIEFKAIPDADRISDLQSGAVDLVAHTMTITCSRLQQIDFSSVYYKAEEELLVLRNSKASGLQDLAGRKVCATYGSDDVATIQRYHAIPYQVNYWSDCLVALQQGQVAGISTDDSILHGLQAQDPFTKIIPQQLEPEPYGLGIAKTHPDFVRFVNAILAQIESNGTWQADYRQWVGSIAPAPPVPRYAS
ncbi:MAG TPA: glutamate ABC transporter substrate-binding protein [Trebonia sp.]